MPSPPPASKPSKLPPRRVKVVNEIIDSLRQDIVTRRLTHGERLPSEKALSERFGVSQPTVREAIRALETLGLVNVLHGNGSFVRSEGDYALASALQTLVQLNDVGISEILEIRQVLALHSIRLASVNAQDRDLTAIETFYERISALGEGRETDEIIALIIDFQRAVSAASHSPLLQSLEAFLLVLITETQIRTISERGVDFLRARAADFQPYRLAIIKALRSGSEVRACEAMDGYLEAQRKVLQLDDVGGSIDLTGAEPSQASSSASDPSEV